MIYKDRCEKHLQMFLLYQMARPIVLWLRAHRKLYETALQYVQPFNYQLSGFEKVKLI